MTKKLMPDLKIVYITMFELLVNSHDMNILFRLNSTVYILTDNKKSRDVYVSSLHNSPSLHILFGIRYSFKNCSYEIGSNMKSTSCVCVSMAVFLALRFCSKYTALSIATETSYSYISYLHTNRNSRAHYIKITTVYSRKNKCAHVFDKCNLLYTITRIGQLSKL